ncbi:hypothetical protein BKA67DRAFT_297003 [Truncatella angustata]|uniref:Uncharacterized protein n=1 Tax=Truncatella angustata TaxID=152316 RepID=A0A9P8UI90_9PEZI|nr:uncharacterized protein BKA67DRAFT_297003 [Truncatella angustata]KAH6652676.1 hypothetical protein BKA67DRAFT_297003 [Truncatella angustata]KAH8195503.1 hypothetical protein TruAng_010332 [Truncatella angustata]
MSSPSGQPRPRRNYRRLDFMNHDNEDVGTITADTPQTRNRPNDGGQAQQQSLEPHSQRQGDWTPYTLEIAMLQPVATCGVVSTLPSEDWIADSMARNPHIEPIIAPFTTTTWPTGSLPVLRRPTTHLCGVMIDNTTPSPRILLMRYPLESDRLLPHLTRIETTPSGSSGSRQAPTFPYSFPQTAYGNEDDLTCLPEDVLTARMRQITGHTVIPLIARFIDKYDRTEYQPSMVAKTWAMQTCFDNQPEQAQVTVSYYACIARESEVLPSIPVWDSFSHSPHPIWVDIETYDKDLVHLEFKDHKFHHRRRMVWWAIEHLVCSGLLTEDQLGNYKHARRTLRNRLSADVREVGSGLLKPEMKELLERFQREGSWVHHY